MSGQKCKVYWNLSTISYAISFSSPGQKCVTFIPNSSDHGVICVVLLLLLDGFAVTLRPDHLKKCSDSQVMVIYSNYLVICVDVRFVDESRPAIQCIYIFVVDAWAFCHIFTPRVRVANDVDCNALLFFMSVCSSFVRAPYSCTGSL